MKPKDLQFEKLHITKSIGLPLQCLDFVVGSLKGIG